MLAIVTTEPRSPSTRSWVSIWVITCFATRNVPVRFTDDHPVPFGGLEEVHRAPSCDARRVHDAVDPARDLRWPSDESCDGLLVGDVGAALNDHLPDPARLLSQARPVSSDDMGSVGDQPLGAGAPDPRGRAASR